MLSGDKAIELWEQVRQKLKIEAGDTVFDNWLGLMVLSSFSFTLIFNSLSRIRFSNSDFEFCNPSSTIASAKAIITTSDS